MLCDVIYMMQQEEVGINPARLQYKRGLEYGAAEYVYV